MKPKPRHLGVQYASQFKDLSVVDAYRFRCPYPEETFKILGSLMSWESPTALDVGCGPGDLARSMTGFAERVDAVDFSEAMIAEGRTRPGGSHPRLNWIVRSLEEASLSSPYGIITAGASIHWLDWPVAFPRLRSALAPEAPLVIINRRYHQVPWMEAVSKVIPEYSTNRDYRSYDIVEELDSRGLFRPDGKRETGAVPFVQSIDDCVETFHSRNGFSRERMTEKKATEFDGCVRQLLELHAVEGELHMNVSAEIVWGSIP